MLPHLLSHFLLAQLHPLLEDQGILLHYLVLRQLFIDAALDSLILLHIVLGYDGQSESFLAHSCCSTNPMNVVLRWRDIVVYHKLDIIYIYSS